MSSAPYPPSAADDSAAKIAALKAELTRERARRRAAERVLQAQMQLFGELIAQLDAAFWYTVQEDDDRNWRVAYVNPAYEHLFNISVEDLHHTPLAWMDVIHPADRARVEKSMLQFQDKTIAHAIEYRIVHPADGLRWVRTNVFPIFEEGHLVRTMGIAYDITARKQTESQPQRETPQPTTDAHSHTAEHPDQLFANITVDFAYIAEFPPDGPPYYSWVRGRFMEITGYDPGELTPENIAEVAVHPDDRALFAERIIRLLSGETDHSEYRMITKDGSVCWLLDHGYSESDPETGRVVRVYGAAQDITARKQAEKALGDALSQQMELHRMKTDFITTVSHEFRTPLSVLMSVFDLLDRYRDQMTQDQREEVLLRGKAQIRHLATLLNNIIMIHQTESNALRAAPEIADIHALCQDVVDQLEREMPETNPVHLYMEIPCAEVLVDAMLLRLVARNLIANARKFSTSDKPVTVTLACTGQDLQFVVRDQGIGIPAADQPHIFESFYRASNAGMIRGTGLGLTVVRYCVQHMGGTVTFTSTVNEGTTFTVTLPRAASFTAERASHTEDDAN